MREDEVYCPAPVRVRRPLRIAFSVLLPLLLAAPLLAQPAAGDHIEIRGAVADPEGRALPQVTVVFEAAREGLNLRDLTMATGRTDERRAVTDPRGVYTIDWPWDPFFNRFEVRVELPVRGPDGERMEVLARRSLTGLRDVSGPLVVNLTVQRAEMLRQLRDFLSRLNSEDERRIYQQFGKPDRVERQTYQGSERNDAAWWYFKAGKVFYFRSGALVEERSFQAVRPF